MDGTYLGLFINTRQILRSTGTLSHQSLPNPLLTFAQAEWTILALAEALATKQITTRAPDCGAFLEESRGIDELGEVAKMSWWTRSRNFAAVIDVAGEGGCHRAAGGGKGVSWACSADWRGYIESCWAARHGALSGSGRLWVLLHEWCGRGCRYMSISALQFGVCVAHCVLTKSVMLWWHEGRWGALSITGMLLEINVIAL